MTREEFEQFMDGEQWTPRQRQQFARFTPIDRPAVVRNEISRTDGIVEVEEFPRRLFCAFLASLGA